MTDTLRYQVFIGRAQHIPNQDATFAFSAHGNIHDYRLRMKFAVVGWGTTPAAAIQNCRDKCDQWIREQQHLPIPAIVS